MRRESGLWRCSAVNEADGFRNTPADIPLPSPLLTDSPAAPFLRFGDYAAKWIESTYHSIMRDDT
jgi:hypothetical protein